MRKLPVLLGVWAVLCLVVSFSLVRYDSAHHNNESIKLIQFFVLNAELSILAIIYLGIKQLKSKRV